MSATEFSCWTLSMPPRFDSVQRSLFVLTLAAAFPGNTCAGQFDRLSSSVASKYTGDVDLGLGGVSWAQ